MQVEMLKLKKEKGSTYHLISMNPQKQLKQFAAVLTHCLLQRNNDFTG